MLPTVLSQRAGAERDVRIELGGPAQRVRRPCPPPGRYRVDPAAAPPRIAASLSTSSVALPSCASRIASLNSGSLPSFRNHLTMTAPMSLSFVALDRPLWPVKDAGRRPQGGSKVLPLGLCVPAFCHYMEGRLPSGAALARGRCNPRDPSAVQEGPQAHLAGSYLYQQ